tara:strand:- start:253 stop:630 length:378 start_codon:yes stop_codon:yes gene_type:complete
MKIKIFFVLILFSSNVLAVSAAPGDRPFVQSNGVSFLGELKGDRWFNWIEDDLGRVIQYNSVTSNYEYTLLNNNNGLLSLSLSGILAADNTPLKANHSALTEIGIIDRTKLSIIAKRSREEVNKN